MDPGNYTPAPKAHTNSYPQSHDDPRLFGGADSSGDARMLNRPTSPPFVVLGAFSGRAYAQMAAWYGARYMLFCTIGLGVMAVGLRFAAGAIAAVYFTDRSLLHGVHTVGVVLQLDG